MIGVGLEKLFCNISILHVRCDVIPCRLNLRIVVLNKLHCYPYRGVKEEETLLSKF